MKKFYPACLVVVFLLALVATPSLANQADNGTTFTISRNPHEGYKNLCSALNANRLKCVLAGVLMQQHLEYTFRTIPSGTSFTINPKWYRHVSENDLKEVRMLYAKELDRDQNWNPAAERAELASQVTALHARIQEFTFRLAQKDAELRAAYAKISSLLQHPAISKAQSAGYPYVLYLLYVSLVVVLLLGIALVVLLQKLRQATEAAQSQPKNGELISMRLTERQLAEESEEETIRLQGELNAAQRKIKTLMDENEDLKAQGSMNLSRLSEGFSLKVPWNGGSVDCPWDGRVTLDVKTGEAVTYQVPCPICARDGKRAIIPLKNKNDVARLKEHFSTIHRDYIPPDSTRLITTQPADTDSRREAQDIFARVAR